MGSDSLRRGAPQRPPSSGKVPSASSSHLQTPEVSVRAAWPGEGCPMCALSPGSQRAGFQALGGFSAQRPIDQSC